MADSDYLPRRNDFGMERRRSRSPDRGRGPRNTEPQKKLDPFTINELVPYTYFCQWYQTLNPGIAIDDSMINRYDDYVADLTARTAKTYVAEQAALPWFRERYNEDPDTASYKHIALDKFRQDLESGTYDQFSVNTADDAQYLGMDEKRDPLQKEGNVNPQLLFIKAVPSKLSKTSLTQFVGNKLDVNFQTFVSTPTSGMSARVGWIVLPEGSNAQDAITLVDNLVIDDANIGRYRLEVSEYSEPAADAPKRLLWSQLNDEASIEQHLAQLHEVIVRKEAALGAEGLWNTIKDKTSEVLLRQLDLGIEYLRNVFYFDYWELQQYGSRFDLQYNSPGYVRSTTVGPSDLAAFEHWSSTHTKKFRIFLDPMPYLQSLRQRPVEEVLQEQIQSKIRKEDETRYRCQVLDCTKLFKDIPFVQKHIEKRHGEWLSQIREEAELLQKYLADPNRLPSYKEYQEPRPAQQDNRNRRRSPQSQRNNGYGGYNHRSAGRGPPGMNYRDLDRPVEDLPELNY